MIWNYVKVLSNVGLSLCNCLGSRICAGANSGYKAIASLCYLRTGSPLIYLGANNNKEIRFIKLMRMATRRFPASWHSVLRLMAECRARPLPWVAFSPFAITKSIPF